MNYKVKDIIRDICNELSLKCTFLSKDWVMMIESSECRRFVVGYKFGLNSQSVCEIFDDKYACYDVLSSLNIPIIEHQIVYDVANNCNYALGCNTHAYVKKYFLAHNNHIVLKPNNGTCGIGVIELVDYDKIDKTLNKLFEKNFSISMCPYYNIRHEYRVIMLDGNAELVYCKYIPLVAGDDNRTIKELLIEFNPNYFSDKLNDTKFDKILSKGEVYQYGWKFNLSQGSTAKPVVDNKLRNELIALAKSVSDAINLRFGSVDIIELQDGELRVLEVNSGVMIENYLLQNPNEYNLVRSIYKKAIIKMFDN